MCNLSVHIILKKTMFVFIVIHQKVIIFSAALFFADVSKVLNFNYSFFQLLTSICPICSHIFKTLNTISTTPVCCNHTISTICVVFTQYAVNYHVSKMLTFSYHTSLPKTKIMDLFSHIYKCLNTACQNWRPNVPNLKYSIQLLLLQQQQLKSIEK